MRCGNCNREGHNRRSCPNMQMQNSETRDRAIILRLDGMTQKEQDEMHIELVRLKKRVTSDKVKATLVEGKASELPSKIKSLIEDKGNE
jgi:hypothetical protein